MKEKRIIEVVPASAAAKLGIFTFEASLGDAKKGALEPFAYWPMDRKMLNRRKAKQKVAQKELGKVVRSAKRQRQG